jgi:hypothetical protein
VPPIYVFITYIDCMNILDTQYNMIFIILIFSQLNNNEYLLLWVEGSDNKNSSNDDNDNR